MGHLSKTRWRFRSTLLRSWYLKAIFFICFTACIVLLNLDIRLAIFDSDTNHSAHSLENVKSVFSTIPAQPNLINTPGCLIPSHDGDNHDVQRFLRTVEPPVCNNGKPPLVELEQTSIYLVSQSFPAYKVKSVRDLHCCYTAFWKVGPDPNTEQVDDLVMYGEKCVEFAERARIDDEFIRVQCTHSNSTKVIYTDYFAFVPQKVNDTVHVSRNEDDKVNVLIIGLDGLSRVNLHRQLPLTLDFLQRNGAVEFFGYNKVADNSFPNLITMLTGQSAEEFQASCMNQSNGFYDRCSFIWDEYKKRGYSTAFVEELSTMGLFFLGAKGFVGQPTHYYGHTYFVEAERKVGNHKWNYMTECLGSRISHHVLLNYTLNFVSAMHDYKLPFYGHFWQSSLTHDFLNKVRISDGDYLSVLQTLQDRGHLVNTVLFFMSDHGLRIGKFRETHQGMMEDRLPSLFVILPDWMREKFPHVHDNLRTNSYRLVTLYDMYETLKDLLHPTQNLQRSQIDTRNKDPSRGYTLFAPITNTRTCKQANIPSHWCTCHNSTVVPISDMVVIQKAHYTVNYINAMLQSFWELCINLSLDKILSARRIHGGTETASEHLLVFRTLPGNAILEATVRSDVNGDLLMYRVSGSISRVNLYGNQSHCIDEKRLKLYCFCKDLL